MPANPVLHARARILAAVRAWFAEQGFVEADVGALAFSPGGEVHTQAFQVQTGAYLHTSPEFAMKRLLAAGEEKIYFLGKVYRMGEEGPLHAPEFTMLEWYRAGAPYDAVMEDCAALVRVATTAAKAPLLRWKDRICDPRLPPERLTVRDAFRSLAGCLPPGDSDAFAATLVSAVEPHLGSPALTVLQEYPLHEAALARRKPTDPAVAERFELYACGVELANGYGELGDAIEQRARLVEAMDEKQRRYSVRWPIDEAFLGALAQMPPAAGCALGLDRLIMLALGAPALRQVLWSFPTEG
jgi:lysyl-tRNA synthetase class 2